MAWPSINTTATSNLPWLPCIIANDPTFTALHVMPFRKLASVELCTLFHALRDHNTHVRELSLSGKRLDADAAQALAEMVVARWIMSVMTVRQGDGDAGVTPFTKLNVGDRGFAAVDEGTGESAFTVFIRRCVELIEGHEFDGDNAAKAVCRPLIESWDLSGKGMDANALQQLLALQRIIAAKAAGACLAIQLDLSHNEASMLGDGGLQALLQSNSCQALNLSGCVWPRVDQVTFVPVSSLRELVWHDFELDADAMCGLGSVLCALSSTLERVFVTGQRNDEGMVVDAGTALGDVLLARALASPLDIPVALTSIYIDGVGIGMEGMLMLRAFLSRKDCSLATLQLSNNRIDAALMELLLMGDDDAHAPMLFPTLQRLVLDFNPVGDNGARALLLSNVMPAVSELSLLGCQLQDCFANALPTLDDIPLPSLESLELSCNQFSGASHMAEYLALLPKLRRVGLGGQKGDGSESEDTWQQQLAGTLPHLDITWKAGAATKQEHAFK